MGGGLYLYLDGRGLAVRGGGARSVLAAYRGLVYATKHDLATGGRCTDDGCVAAGQARGPAAPFGPRQPRRIQPVVATPSTRRCLWDDLQDG